MLPGVIKPSGNKKSPGATSKFQNNVLFYSNVLKPIADIQIIYNCLMEIYYYFFHYCYVLVEKRPHVQTIDKNLSQIKVTDRYSLNHQQGLFVITTTFFPTARFKILMK